jgi:ATP-dependent DNA helicase DinG
VVEVAVPILEASGGRAFLLFTSHRALREAAELLEERLDLPLLAQGDAPKADLLERFVEHGNAVLLGTSSFWEGVDVRGGALSVVIIDKLPFASPGDPVLQARLEAIRRRGGNPFMDYQVPQAAIALKQGAGRLIRDVGDQGVLVLCDPRLLKKGYGQTFLDAMPPFARTRDLDQVLTFFQ